MRFRFPFVRRIALAFLLMAAVVSGVFSFAIVLIVHHVEEHLVSEKLKEDLNIILASNSDVTLAQLNSDTHFYSSLSRQHPIPDYLADIPQGFSELDTVTGAYYVYNREQGDRQYLLVQDQHVLVARERLIYQAVMLCFLLIILASWALGTRIARMIMRPVSRLARQVDQRAAQESAHSSLASEYADDEIGHLAGAFDGAFNRLHFALDRERLFTSDVSHELRTPLMVMSTSCELLREMTLSESQGQQVERMAAATRHIKELVETFLNLARDCDDASYMNSGVTLAALAQEILPGIREACAHKGLAFSLLDEGSTRQTYHSVFLRAVMLNLLQNAIHYTPSGCIRMILGPEGFSVEDSGPGIADHEQQRLFMPFQRGKDVPGEGLGLGLSLVKRICEHSGWEIEMKSLAPSGSAFFIKLS